MNSYARSSRITTGQQDTTAGHPAVMQNRSANTQQRQCFLDWIQILTTLRQKTTKGTRGTNEGFFELDTDLAFVIIWGGQYGVPFGLALRGSRYTPGGLGCLQGCLQVGPESCPGARTINNHERLIGKPPPVERSAGPTLDPHLWGRTFAFDPLPPDLGPGSRARPPNFFRSIVPPLILNELPLFCQVFLFALNAGSFTFE